MSDDKTKTFPQDASKVNVNEPYEVRYWTEKFKVTPDALREAVKKVGPLADKVEKELKN